MKRFLLVFALQLPAWCGSAVPFRQSGFAAGGDGLPDGWRAWSQRAETAQRVFVDIRQNRGKPGSLAVSGNSNPAGHGGWQKDISGIEGGAWYRFRGYYKAEGIVAESWQVVARLDWQTAAGKRTAEPAYPFRARRDGEWTLLTGDFQAPANATAMILDLYLSHAPLGTVWWDDIAVEKVPSPAPRPVTIASINLRPQSTKASAESVRQFIETAERVVPQGTDLILFPEGITVIGTGKSYVDVAEPIPGPTTNRLAQLAKKRSCYVAAGLYEREGPAAYNTAVLFDRSGEMVGKYRKVYLPAGEVEGGLSPGNHYPVFRTDFGTVGMMICYDVFFADPARALAARGAEIILLPIWGGDETLAKARAIENGIFLVASGYDHPTYVMDPVGVRLSTAKELGTAAVATIDLSRRYVKPFMGEWRSRRMKELRLDIKPVELPGLEQ